MVSPTCFSSTDIGRYSHRGNPYVASSPYTERRLGGYSHHDLRGSMMAEREMHEEPSSQRKRIAVACGRCRKRKIRCTGDNGSGQPCQNCRNAGHEPCQFLRVASQEAPMKNETFPYSIDVSRHFQARGPAMVPSGPSPISPYAETMAMPGSEALSYRNGSAYAYNGRSMYSVSGWSSGYADDAIDYAMYQTTPSPGSSQQQHHHHHHQHHQHQHQHHPYQAVAETAGYMVGYRMAPSPVQATKPSGGGGGGGGSSSLYMDPEPGCGYSSATPTSGGLVHRPGSTSAADAGGYSYQSVSASLSGHGGDRILPTPTPRPLSSAGQHAYRAESISSGYSKTSQSSNGGSSPAPLSEAVGTYNSYENSPMPTSYPSVSLSSAASRQSSDVYTTTSAPALRPDGDEPALRSAGPEFTYKYHDTTSHYRSTYHGNLGLGGSAAVAIAAAATTGAGAGAGAGASIGQSYLGQTQGQGGSYLVGPDLSTDVAAERKSSDLHTMRPS